MRYYLLFLFLLCISATMQANHKNSPVRTDKNVSVSATEVSSPSSPKEKKFDLKDVKNQAFIAFGASLLGSLLILIPYVSLLGLALGLGGLVLGWMIRKKVEKKLWARLAITLGALCLLVFVATLVLVIFV